MANNVENSNNRNKVDCWNVSTYGRRSQVTVVRRRDDSVDAAADTAAVADVARGGADADDDDDIGGGGMIDDWWLMLLLMVVEGGCCGNKFTKGFCRCSPLELVVARNGGASQAGLGMVLLTSRRERRLSSVVVIENILL